MAFEKSHWVNPRQKIANRWFDNDYGYMLHAGQLFVELLRASNIKPSAASGMKILDYGCGTGRVTRFFALFFREAVGYDPVRDCIDEGAKESERVGGAFLEPYLTSDLNEIGGEFDIIVSINVLEHLSPEVFDAALKNIEKRMKEGGESYLWLHGKKNANFFARHNLRFHGKNIAIIRGRCVKGRVVYDSV